MDAPKNWKIVKDSEMADPKVGKIGKAGKWLERSR